MHAALEWLKAGSPAHWEYGAAALYVAIEWLLPRSKNVEANSVLELVANALCRVPLVSLVAVKLATPKKPALEQPK